MYREPLPEQVIISQHRSVPNSAPVSEWKMVMVAVDRLVLDFMSPSYVHGHAGCSYLGRCKRNILELC